MKYFYKLKQIYPYASLSGFTNDIKDIMYGSQYAIVNYSGMLMGLGQAQLNDIISFISLSIWNYYCEDLIAYPTENDDPQAGEQDAQYGLMIRMCYDIAVKLPYWYKKYNYIKKLLTTEDLSLLQTSKMTSSSNDTTKSAGGTLQKTATTPTGVSATGSTDSINIDIKSGTSDGDNDVETNGFADKYTNAQQKFANATRVEGERSGEILREGSIDDLLKVLEKLPSSFADEVTKEVQKHFVFDYDGEEKGIYKLAYN